MVLLELQTGGDGQDRTADLLIANQSLSQLSYAPESARFYAARIDTSIMNAATLCAAASRQNLDWLFLCLCRCGVDRDGDGFGINAFNLVAFLDQLELRGILDLELHRMIDAA